MSTIQLNVHAFSAWAPGLNDLNSWIDWARGAAPIRDGPEKPSVNFLPVQLRRRCSAMTRAALSVAYAVVPANDRANVRSLFASRHGESQTTLALLNSLAREEVVSPLDFSLSVHNTCSGLFSIATGNHATSSAIAAGKNTIYAALVETYSLMYASKEPEPVLCVIADEPLPPIFNEPGNSLYVALAFYCVPPPPASGALQLEISCHTPTTSAQPLQLLDYDNFLRWLFSEKACLSVVQNGSQWQICKNSGADLKVIYKEPAA